MTEYAVRSNEGGIRAGLYNAWQTCCDFCNAYGSDVQAGSLSVFARKNASAIRNAGYYPPEQRTGYGDGYEVFRSFSGEFYATITGDLPAMVLAPKETCEGLSYACSNPIDTVGGVVVEGCESFQEDPYRATGAGLSYIIPAGLAGKAGKTAVKSAGKVAAKGYHKIIPKKPIDPSIHYLGSGQNPFTPVILNGMYYAPPVLYGAASTDAANENLSAADTVFERAESFKTAREEANK